jgi:hypothetical protein
MLAESVDMLREAEIPVAGMAGLSGGGVIGKTRTHPGESFPPSREQAWRE